MNRISLILLLLLILLGFRLYFFYTSQQSFRDGQKIDAVFTLFDEPRTTGTKQTISYNIGLDTLRIVAPAYPQYHYGDRIRISGPIRLLPRSGGGASSYVIYFPKTERVSSKNNSFLAVVGTIRQKIVLLFVQTLPAEYAGLLLGIVFGIRESMSASFSTDLRLAGLTHVIAASGMNVTMVASFAAVVFGTFLKRQQALIVSIVFILLYSLLAGFQASIMRAAIMSIILCFGQLFGRQVLAIYSLCLTGIVMLFLFPYLLVDIGFQLSFVSTLGLLVIPHMLEKISLFRVMSTKVIIGEDILTTIAAQIATLPLLLSYFGTYSLWSIVVNTIVLWTIPILMVVGGIAACIGIVIPAIGSLLLYICLPFLVYFKFVAHFFAHLPGVIHISLPWPFVVGYYLILVGFLLYLKKSTSIGNRVQSLK